MKTSFFGKGKFKLVLFLTLCAVVLGCAIFLCLDIYHNNYNQAEEPASQTQTEISAPDREATATALTKVPYPSPKFVEGSGTVSGITATAEYTGSMIRIIPGDSWNSDYYQTTNPVAVGTNPGTYTSGGIGLKDGYCWQDGTTAGISYTLIITKKKIPIPAPKFGAGSGTITGGLTATAEYTGEEIVILPGDGWDGTYMATTNPVARGTTPGTYTSGGFGLQDTSLYMWSDGTTTSKYYTLTITKKKITKPAPKFGQGSGTISGLTGTAEYTGEPIVLIPGDSLPTGCSTTNPVASGTTPGTYKGGSIYITDESLYVWSDGTTASISYTLTITAKSISSSMIANLSDQTYTGKEIKPTPSVKYGDITLTSGTDYTLSYSNNTNVGTATVTVTGKGNYKGTASKTFKIVAKSISGATIGNISAYTYDGTEHKPTPTVTLSGFTPTVSYTYSSNVNAGTDTATVTIKGTGNFTGTLTKKFTINPRDISNTTNSTISNQTYTGSEIKPTPTVKDGSTTLTNGTHYTLSYSNNINVGTAGVIITGKGNYTGAVAIPFTIVAKSISGASFGTISAYTYDGSAKQPTPTVTLSGTVLTKGTHYTLSYSDNVNAGTAKITATGTGNYSGSISTTFTISPVNLSSATIGSISAYTYDGSAKKPTPTVKLGTATLTNNTHYTLSYSNNTNAGTATVTVTGTGNYTGSVSKDFTISPRNVSNLTVGAISAQTYTGNPITPAPTVKDGNTTLTNNTHYTLTYTDNVNAGTATVTITGVGNYGGTRDVTFTINGKSLSGATVGALDSFVYNGEEHKPTATVTLDGVTLSSGTDFTFVYSNNVNAGTATVTVKGKGNYSGEKSANFTINPRNISGATAAAIADQAYTGSAKTPLPALTDLSKTLTKDTDYTLTYADNTNVGTAKITVTGNGNYNGTKEVTFIIIARSISGVTVSAISPYTYDGTAKEPAPTVTDGSKTLTEDVDYTLSYRDNVNVGTATLILTGMGNYTGTKEVGFSIQPPSLDGATVTLSETSFTYDGNAKEPRVTSVEVDGVTLRAGTDYTVSYTNNINAGTAKAVITAAGDYVGTTEVTFTISPANIANGAIEGLQITYTYTGAAISPEITVTFGGNTLVKNTDYLVSYTGNTDVGTATVTVTGSRNFTGTLTDNFAIISADIAPATLTGVNATYAYTTTAITPEPTVTWNGILLVKDTDYTLSYADNTDLGTATITVAGLGNFSGTATKTFEIVQADITSSTVTGINATYTYTGSDIEPTVTVVLNGVTLTPDTDYTVAYADNLNVGTATVTITGCGNYTGTVTRNFDVVEADMDDVTVTGIDATYEYTGAAIAPEPTVTANGITLVKDTDYTVAYADNTDLGTATITITGLGNFTAVKTVTFEIVAADIANATVTGVDGEYGYTGSAIAPEPTVTLNGAVLVKDTDYSLSYVNNNDLGEAVINITGIGNYTGLKSTGFRIVEADADGATVTGIDEEYPWTGAAIEPEPAVTLNGVTLVKDTDFTVVYTDNTELGTATYAITFIGNYTGSAGGTFEIVKATPEVEITLDYDGVSPLFVGKALPAISAVATYNGATVAGTVSWDTDGGSAPTLKENENDYNWTFTPDDTDHYEAVTGSETLTAQRPQYIAIRAEWKNGTQPALFTSTSITVVKQNLKITGIFSDGATDEIIGGYSFVINGADGTVYTSIPAVGGNDYSITVTFGDVPPCTDLVGVVISGVALDSLAVEPADGGNITTDYTAFDKFDTASVKVTAKYNDGTEKTVEFGNGGYSVIYAQGGGYLQFEDTKVTLSFTENGVTRTADVEGLNVVKKAFDASQLAFNPADRSYAFGNTVTGDIKVENMPAWLQVTYEYEDAEGNAIEASDVKNAGTYKVTAKFTVNKNYEDIEDMTATFKVTPVEPELTPAVGGSYSEGTVLKDMTITAPDGTTTGTLTWDDVAYKLKAGVNRCYYTFTPDDTVNFKVVHGYVDIMADVPVPENAAGAGLVGWQVALIAVSAAVALLALIALLVALKSRRMTDADGFYDDASPEDMN